MNKIIIQTSNLIVGQGKFQKQISDLVIREGELVHIKGPNGSGKSTLLKTIAGKITALKGEIKFLPNTSLTFIPQHSESEILLPLTLREWLSAYGAKNIPANIIQDTVLNKRWRDASGGEKQKVSLLAKIQSAGSVLILDEPFNHIDEIGKEETEDFIQDLLNKNLLSAVIIVSHQTLKRGRVVQL